MRGHIHPATSWLVGLLGFISLAGCRSDVTSPSRVVKSEQIIASEGGSITVTQSDDPALAGTSLVIPPNALSANTTITIEATTASIAPPGSTAIGPVVDFEPSGLVFATPATMTLPATLPSEASPLLVFIEAVEQDGTELQVPAQYANGFATAQVGGFTNFGASLAIPATEPQFSSQQCYFTSYPIGSLQCVTAPCTVTNVATANPTCATSDTDFVNFEVAGAIYGAYLKGTPGEIVALYPNPSTTFPTCIGGATIQGNEPGDPGDYYATGLIVGQTTQQEIANFCTGTIGTFP